jgi:Mak16 protein
MRRAKLHTQCVPFLHVIQDPQCPHLRRPKLVGIKKKTDRREAVRERKALAAAHLERAIEKELLERLKSKAYGDAPLNVNESVWTAILDKEKALERGDELEDEETEEEELEGEAEEEWEEREFVSDVSESEDELSDLEQVMVRGHVSCFDNAPCIYSVCRVEWIVATTMKSPEMIMMQMRRQAQNQYQNQNRRSENEKRNSVRASQDVRITLSCSVRLFPL